LGRKRPAYMSMRLSKRLSVYVFFVAFALAFWWLAENSSAPRSPRLTVRPAKTLETNEQESVLGQPSLERVVDRVLKGESLSQTLSRNGFSQAESFTIVEILHKEINLKAIRPGDAVVSERKLLVEQDKVAVPVSPFEAFELVRNEANGLPVRYRIQRKPAAASGLAYELIRILPEVSTRQETLVGAISTSLYDGILLSGGDPALVNRFSDFFGWQIDFYRETQRDDIFKMVVEAKYVDGRFVGYGKISAAEYATGNRVFRGFAYESVDGENTGIYDAMGVGLEKTFLKSPLELARITSSYGQRFHPILRTQKKHNGVDYGASTGTPFWAVADGVVSEARYSPSAGNMIRIKHRNGYSTEYFHASRIAPGVRAGAHVRQRQIIGYVGTTGRSTGPHLHFGMMLEKNYVDPSKQNFPTGHSLPKKDLARFQTMIAPWVAELARAQTPEITASR
jgi:murein DD-endopeptidase MepM/ murein hydrolase activator NlpD